MRVASSGEFVYAPFPLAVGAQMFCGKNLTHARLRASRCAGLLGRRRWALGVVSITGNFAPSQGQGWFHVRGKA